MSTKKTKKSRTKKTSSRTRKNSRVDGTQMRAEDVSVLLSARHTSSARNNRRKKETPVDITTNSLYMDDDRSQVTEEDDMGLFERRKVAMSSDLLTPAEIDDSQKAIDDDTTEVVDVVLPIIVESQRDTKSAFEIQTERIDRIMQSSGSNALKKLYTVRHGAQSRKPATSTAGAETKYALEEQYKQFEEGVRSIPDDLETPATGNDISRAELIGALFDMPQRDAENLSARTLDFVADVPKRHRATEEEYLRAPFYEGERECRNADRCQGRFAVRMGGFTLVEYNSLELVEHRKEHQANPGEGLTNKCEQCQSQLCVICSRMLQQQRWATSAARNCAYDQDSVPNILPDYHNLIGPGEYDAHHVYSCSTSKIQFPELPVVIFCNTSFRRSERQMNDGSIVPEYKQVLTKPEVPAFRDGRV